MTNLDLLFLCYYSGCCNRSRLHSKYIVFGLQPVETCQENISTGEKKSKQFHLSDDARPYRATKGLHDMYTRTFMLFHKWELVLLSSAAEMLLGRTSINQRVFKEGIIIGDLKRSFSPLIDSSVEVVPGRQFPARLLSTVDINVTVRSQRWHSETAE